VVAGLSCEIDQPTGQAVPLALRVYRNQLSGNQLTKNVQASTGQYTDSACDLR
jgi:hypothetical protein